MWNDWSDLSKIWMIELEVISDLKTGFNSSRITSFWDFDKKKNQLWTWSSEIRLFTYTKKMYKIWEGSQTLGTHT